MFEPSPAELILILAIMLLLFGNKLPSIMRSLGRSVNEFKKGVNEITDASVTDAHELPAAKQASQDAAIPAQTSGEHQAPPAFFDRAVDCA